MRSNYKKLGDFIRRCDEFNIGMEVKELLGISNNKYFQRSHTNTIGIDLSTYRIVRTGQFAYNRATTRNGDKISIALRQGNDCIVSPSYRIFQVIDENQLLSEYLMMWFRRSEFDRYARFRSHGSAHEFFEWEEMCNVELPIPDITKQREIVKEYNVLVNRIALNNQLIQKLEETAQAIYKQWFVDFEFPDEEGKPYKSNGGEMVESEFGEIPKNWQVSDYETVINFKTGKLNSNAAVENGKYQFFTCSSETFKTNTYSFNTEAVILAGNNASAIYPLKYFVGKFDAYQRTYIITSKCNLLSNKQIYFSLKDELENFKGISSGTATKFLTIKILNNLKIVISDEFVHRKFDFISNAIFNKIQILQKEQEILNNLHNTILVKIIK
jgi:type I restriction enzyme S subunit